MLISMTGKKPSECICYILKPLISKSTPSSSSLLKFLNACPYKWQELPPNIFNIQHPWGMPKGFNQPSCTWHLWFDHLALHSQIPVRSVVNGQLRDLPGCSSTLAKNDFQPNPCLCSSIFSQTFAESMSWSWVMSHVFPWYRLLPANFNEQIIVDFITIVKSQSTG